MPSSEPRTIPLPISLSATTPTLPSTTQEALIAHLRETSSIPELSSLLSDSLARTGWTDRVRALALELLRNGNCDTFPELMAEVLRRAKIPKPNASSTSRETMAANGAGTQTNGTVTPTASQSGAGMNGAGSITVSKEWSGGPDGLPDVRIPEVTVESGVEFLKEKIKDVVEVVDEDDDD